MGVRLPGVDGWEGEGGIEGRAERGSPDRGTESVFSFLGVDVWRGVWGDGRRGCALRTGGRRGLFGVRVCGRTGLGRGASLTAGRGGTMCGGGRCALGSGEEVECGVGGSEDMMGVFLREEEWEEEPVGLLGWCEGWVCASETTELTWLELAREGCGWELPEDGRNATLRGGGRGGANIEFGIT